MDPTVVQTRLGHYHVPGKAGSDGYEHTALVVKADPEAGTVNLTVWNYEGDQYARTSVPVVQGLLETPEGASFHLVSACTVTQ